MKLKVNKSIVRTIFICMFVSLLATVRCAGQDMVECDDDDLDGGICFCDECGSEPPHGGGCAAYSGTYMVAYADGADDGNGNLEFWTTISNADGNYGEGRLRASVSGTLPDGYAIPATTAITSSDPSVTSSSSVSHVVAADSGQGEIDNTGQINWSCGPANYAAVRGKISLSSRTYHYSDISSGLCHYILACPSGTSPTCTTNDFYAAAPCAYDWAQDYSIALIYGSTLKCFGTGPGQLLAYQGTCS